MFKSRNRNKVEEGLFFTFALTFIGGYMNAYSFFVRGGSLVTMQSGNMARIGLAVYMKDMDLFVISIIPILGCFLGVTIFQIVKRKHEKMTEKFWQKFSMFAEISIFMTVGFIPSGFHDHFINFVIAMAAGFQICNLKTYGGYTHTTTLGSGNVRNLGQIFGDAIVNHDKKSIKLFVEYFVIMSTFTIGALVGSVISHYLGIFSIWVCGTLMCVLIGMILKEEYHNKLNSKLISGDAFSIEMITPKELLDGEDTVEDEQIA